MLHSLQCAHGDVRRILYLTLKLQCAYLKQAFHKRDKAISLSTTTSPNNVLHIKYSRRDFTFVFCNLSGLGLHVVYQSMLLLVDFFTKL